MGLDMEKALESDFCQSDFAEKLTPVGNSALEGAARDARHTQRAVIMQPQEIAAISYEINLFVDTPEFQELYLKHMHPVESENWVFIQQKYPNFLMSYFE